MVSIVENPSRNRWLYIDFNSYFASVEQQLNPSLRGKPVAVVPVMTDATCAIAASYEAKAFGIKTGTPIYEAKKLCADLVLVHAQHERYVDFHDRIQVEVARHIPVSVTASIDEVACYLMENEAPHARELALQIKAGLAANVGAFVKCSIGIAPTKYLAKIATDLKKPDGLTVLNAQDLPGPLLGLVLRDLPGVGHNMERRLQAAGVRSMRHLWQMSPRQARAAWGSIWGEKIWYWLHGYDVPDDPTHRSSIGHSHVLAPELRLPEQARYVARRLTAKAASRLRREGYYATCFSLSVRLEDGAGLGCEARCFRAQDTITFLRMLETQWQSLMRESRGVRLKKIAITLHGLVAEASLQPELFSALPDGQLQRRQRAERMSRALDTINHRYGRDTVALGMLPDQGRSFSGTKIAFTRIPDKQEFLE